ncbi:MULTISPECIES: YveK family protein [unclassified Mycobacterium]|uniref:YveK family protein n=1 Tax=unclassified Mycobacterium TaxID=2642494 RepID=UPI0029C74EF7|nr:MULTISPECIES: Wzz/FepE/Etk N-terminal domain-containing protein [unclassified Mycobacterium]
MIPPPDAPKAADYLRILGRRWWILVCATALAAGLGWVSWQTETPIYTSSAKVLITSPGSATPLDALYGQVNAESRVITYQYLARSARVTERVIDELGLSETTDELAGRISIPLTLTAVLDVNVKGTDAEETRKVADAVTSTMVTVSQELAKVDTAGTELVVVDEAGPAKRDGSMWQSIIRATVLGFIVALVLVLALGLLEDRLLARRQVGRVVDGAVEG